MKKRKTVVGSMTQVTFGKYKDTDIKDVPLNYVKWAKMNISNESKRQMFEDEFNRRESGEPVLAKIKYDPLIFGKDQTEGIVNITVEEDGAFIYMTDGSHKKVEYKPWAIGKAPDPKATKLKGNQYYKYIRDFDLEKYKLLTERRPRGVWYPRGIEEGFMLRNGHTCFKGMKVKDVSVLSFDIEATGLDGTSENAEAILISNTFRDRNGKITKKLFDIHDHKLDYAMIKDWCSWVNEMNPDILIGHNIFGYDFEYLANRSSSGLPIGRNEECMVFNQKPSKFRKDGSQQYSYYDAKIHGRDIVDTMFLSIKYDIGRNFPSYGLKRIEEHLGLVDNDRIEWDFKNFPTHEYKTWPEGKWEEFRKYCMDDSDSPLKMFDIMIPAFFYLAQSVPKSLQQIINEASGSQLDSLMVRSYLQEGHSQPMTSGKEPFQGAISMGVPGVYEHARKVDVASLYPSIMLQYDVYDKKKDPNRNMLGMLEYFRDQRLENKRLAKETGEQHYDDMQAAQKIMINSMYGFMGAGFLLYNYPIGAAEVTKYGRDILLKGVEWATGHTLERVIKKVTNRGKDNESIKYEWVVSDKISEGKGYELVNVDTDSFSVTNGVKPTSAEFDKEIKELNSLYGDLIVWEDDGVFDKIIVVKAKNYVLVSENKIKYKGSSLTDQKKEPVLIELLEEVIGELLDGKQENVSKIYNNYCKRALNPKDINKWTVKKTITKSVLNPERSHEQKVLDACNLAIDSKVITNIQEGDKVWVYTALNGQKQKVVKGEPVFKKDGTASMVDSTRLKFSQMYDGDHDKWHFVKRVFATISILENVLDMSQIENYSLKKNRKVLESL